MCSSCTQTAPINTFKQYLGIVLEDTDQWAPFGISRENQNSILENHNCFPARVDQGTQELTGLKTVYELHMGILKAFPNPLT